MGTGWQYRTLKLEQDVGFFHSSINFPALDAKLNEIGLEGWELVNVIYAIENSLGFVIAFLKRPLE